MVWGNKSWNFIPSQVPGVEADDVIGTLAVRSVDDGYKVSILNHLNFHMGIIHAFISVSIVYTHPWALRCTMQKDTRFMLIIFYTPCESKTLLSIERNAYNKLHLESIKTKCQCITFYSFCTVIAYHSLLFSFALLCCFFSLTGASCFPRQRFLSDSLPLFTSSTNSTTGIWVSIH